MKHSKLAVVLHITYELEENLSESASTEQHEESDGNIIGNVGCIVDNVGCIVRNSSHADGSYRNQKDSHC